MIQSKYFKTFNDAYKASIIAVDQFGVKQRSRNGEMKELVNTSFCIPLGYDSTTCTIDQRNLSEKYAVAESLWLFSGARCGNILKNWAPNYDKYLESDGKAYWAYGARCVNWFPHLAKLLSKDPNTRRAVVNIWSNDDIERSIYEDVKDVPCLVSLQFFVRGRCLDLRITQRSQDVWLGFPNDIFIYNTIGEVMAGELGLNLGKLYYSCGS